MSKKNITIIFALIFICLLAGLILFRSLFRTKYLTYQHLKPYQSKADIIKKRNDLIAKIWGTDASLPSNFPSNVKENIEYPFFQNLNGVRRVDEVEIRMDYDLISIGHFLIPERPSNHLLIYHQGHHGGPNIGVNAITHFINKGFYVFTLSMPLTGKNPNPSFVNISGKSFPLKEHRDFKLLENEPGEPIRFFIEPVIVGLNYILDAYPIESVAMMGISGGGWTTVLAAAVDPRIQTSIPVAGSLPLFLRDFKNKNDWGDYEQREPGLYDEFSYIDFYLLASSGENRKQIQIFNEFDPIAFSGTRGKIYEGPIQHWVNKLGAGSFSVKIDPTTTLHTISPHALKLSDHALNP